MTNDNTFFENELLEFIGEPGPLSDMMRWLAEQLMEIEVPKKASAPKGVRSQNERPVALEHGFGGSICGRELRAFACLFSSAY